MLMTLEVSARISVASIYHRTKQARDRDRIICMARASEKAGCAANKPEHATRHGASARENGHIPTVQYVRSWHICSTACCGITGDRNIGCYTMNAGDYKIRCSLYLLWSFHS